MAWTTHATFSSPSHKVSDTKNATSDKMPDDLVAERVTGRRNARLNSKASFLSSLLLLYAATLPRN